MTEKVRPARRRPVEGTIFLEIAESLRRQIRDDPEIVELPKVADLAYSYGVVRGTVSRAFATLHQEGIIERAPNSRWQVVRTPR